MNTNQLKRFAQAARKKLLEQIGAKLEYVLTSDSAELREKADQVRQLKTELELTSKAMLVEKVAYTWFNRLVALRFMDVNDYQPTGVRVVSPKDGYTLPELLDEAKQGNIPAELEVDKKRINDLLDGRIPSTNPQNEVYKLLLIASCNYLHMVFPFLYERINDYTELLLPDDLTSDFSVLQDVREGMSAEDASQVEIIGWLYQFYISEKKDEVFASKEKVKKEDIPAATQLFTPRWIVEYMVQNTLGKLWLQNRPNSKLRDHMPYFIESESLKPKDYLKISSPEEIKFLDQAVGSGHILVYSFELLTKIYEEEGYNQAEIPTLIIKNNLYGNEIDERAAQLAGLALMMKAREYDKRFFRRSSIPEPNILCFKDLRLQNNELQSFLNRIKLNVSNELWHDLVFMRQATNLGSIIDPHSSLSEIEKSIEKLGSLSITLNAFEEFEKEELARTLRQLIHLKNKYHCVVDNPPYMGGGKMNGDLADYVRTYFPDAKADLLTCFIERAINQVHSNGFMGFVTMESWMFLSSFENFRKNILDNLTIHSLSHFGWHIMRIAFGTVSFILENIKPKEAFKGVYSYMEYDNINRETERPILFPIKDNGRYNIISQKNFERIPSSPIGYWLSTSLLNCFQNDLLSKVAETRLGMATADNDRFLRLFWEVDRKKTVNNEAEKNVVSPKWYKYAKGGIFRKWFGNNEYYVNWSNNGFEILNIKDEKGKIRSHNYNLDYIFKDGITWNALSSNDTSFRILSYSLFDNAGSSLFLRDSRFSIFEVLALLNSKVIKYLIPVINPTLNYQPGTISKIPIIKPSGDINQLVKSAIEISKLEYNSKEISLEYEQNEIIRIKGQNIEDSFELYVQFWKTKFTHLKRIEEDINHKYIDAYSLQDELTNDVPLEEITILKEETSVEDGQLLFHPDEVFGQFISYSVGCMFGRYSLDKEGLILANQGEGLEDYLKIVKKKKTDITFLPDDDNIIPVLNDEWFEDDIVGRFKEFLGVTFGESNIDKNLAFVESAIGTDIRKYFLKNFYKDHIQRYKKRPIYWMFSSPKEHFNVLIYLHRYTPDTLNNILNKYLREFIEKLKTRKEHLQHIIVSGNATEQNKAMKQLDKIDEMILDCQEYEREILFPLAAERIEIDLDEGVLVNYNRFGKAIKEVQGLNDKKTKKQVMEFDWIDASQIR